MGYRAALKISGTLLLLLLGARIAAAADSDPRQVLRQVTEAIAAANRRIPNYTCVETVERDFFRPSAATLPRACALVLEERRHPTLAMVLRRAVTDRLRLDVAMVERGEIFSWVGASRFDEAGIEHLVRRGPIATGAFGGFLAVVFQQDVGGFMFEGDVHSDGRDLMEYSFRVASARSHYKVKIDNSWAYISYSGRVQVDPHLNQIVRMTVEAGELPGAAHECMELTALEFEMEHIDGVDFPLATRTRQRFVLPDGQETENNTTFANCREYKGESTIRFDTAAHSVVATHDPTARSGAGVPTGSRFTIELTTPIAADTAAAGDPFAGKLVSGLLDPKGKRLAPAGALVEGRLLRVQSFHEPPEQAVFVLSPQTVEFGGSKVPLTAVRDWTKAVSEARSKKAAGVKILLPLPGEDYAGVFQFAGQHVVVSKGFRSDWRTASIPNAPGPVK